MMDIRNHRDIEAAAAAWLARRDAGEHWSDDDERALQAWIAESVAHRVAWLRLDAAWERTERLPALAPADTVSAQESRPNRRHRRRAILGWALAASLALGVGVAWMVQFYPPGAVRFATEVGGREAVTLADGSRVTLNTHTRGRALVNEQERRFWLEEGEAYFEVAHDPARPFVVMAGKDRVTVLGTRFSVRYEDGRTEVTVLEGRVRLDRGPTGAAPSTPVVMTRNDAVVAQGGSVLVISRTDQQVRDELSWRQGQLAFEQMALGDVAAEFNRYNTVKLVVEGDASDMRVSGSFDAQNVQGFARLAHEGFGLTVRREGNRIVLSGD